jgi:hypothetical protein
VKHAKTIPAPAVQVHALEAVELEAITGGRGGCCGSGGERSIRRGPDDCAPGEACADGRRGPR